MLHTPDNPGKYDPETTMVRELTKAQGAVLIIVGGNKGHGFSVQASPEVLIALPGMLETMAAEIRRDLKGRAS